MSTHRTPRLIAVLLFGALVVVACSSGRSSEGSSGDTVGAGWSFTDDRGITHTLDAPPQTIAAQSVIAGGLWEYGVVADGVFGPLRFSDGAPDPSMGLADPADFQDGSLGEVDSQINLEKLAALAPDIIVAPMWGDDMYWGIDDAQMDQIEQIAPIVGLRMDARPVTEPLARVAELAATLPDYDDAAERDAKEAFDASSEHLRAALVAKPGLAVVAASGTATEMYIAYPPVFPDLSYYQSLGMQLAEPANHPTSGGFWETLSWEEAGKYPADLILADARGGSVEQMLALLPATALALPAVQADQWVAWPATGALGYGNNAKVLDTLTAAVQAASSDVA
jgi:iron complex transport system substrate-binding protein